MKLVGGLARISEEAAKRVAEALGAQLFVARDYYELCSVGRELGSVVLPLRLVSSQLLHCLFERGTGSFPSIVPLNDSLLDASSRIVHSSRLGERPLRINFFPSAPVGWHRINESEYIGSGATAAELSNAWSSGARVLTIFAHSDGIDVNLGGGILCGVKRHSEGEAVSRVLTATCVERRWCHRLSLPISVALQNPRLIDPAVVEAGLVISMACFSVPVAETPGRAQYSFLEQMFLSGGVRSAIAMWGIGFVRPKEIEPLQIALDHGASVGEAAIVLSNIKAVREGRLRWSLLGDPDYRPFVATSASAAIRSETIDPGQIKNISFEEALIFGCHMNAFNARTFEAAAALKLNANSRSLLEAICAFGTMPSKQWLMGDATITNQGVEQSVCSYCGGVTTTYRSLGFHAEQRRILECCPSCGVTQDFTENLGPIILELTARGDLMVLVKRPLPIEVDIRLLIEHSKDAAPAEILLTREQLLSGFSLPSIKPGLTTLCLVIVTGASVGVYRRVLSMNSSVELSDIALRDRPARLITNRILLRPPRHDDMQEVFEYASNDEAAKYLTWKAFRHVSEAEQYVCSSVLAWRVGARSRVWFIELRNTGKVIGSLRLKRDGSTADIGYIINPEYQRIRLASEAILAMLTWLATTDTKTVEAIVDMKNDASCGLLGSLGFSIKSVLRSHVVHPNIDSRPRDCLHFEKILDRRSGE